MIDSHLKNYSFAKDFFFSCGQSCKCQSPTGNLKLNTEWGKQHSHVVIMPEDFQPFKPKFYVANQAHLLYNWISSLNTYWRVFLSVLTTLLCWALTIIFVPFLLSSTQQFSISVCKRIGSGLSFSCVCVFSLTQSDSDQS